MRRDGEETYSSDVGVMAHVKQKMMTDRAFAHTCVRMVHGIILRISMCLRDMLLVLVAQRATCRSTFDKLPVLMVLSSIGYVDNVHSGRRCCQLEWWVNSNSSSPW